MYVTHWYESRRTSQVPVSLHLFIFSPAGRIRRVPDEISPWAPLFFLSYAQAAGRRRPDSHRRADFPVREPNRDVIAFFDDLNRDVAELVDRPTGADPGFIDRDIPAGSLWEPTLLQAIGTCQVFVALMSARYFTSPWCGREWHAFSQRTVTPRARSRAGPRNRHRPGRLGSPPGGTDSACGEQGPAFLAERPAEHRCARPVRSRGHLRAFDTGLDVPYKGVVWRLAQRIAAYCRSHGAANPRVFSPEELRDAFEEDAS